MVDPSKLKPGDRVEFRNIYGGQPYIDKYQSATGEEIDLNDGHIFTVADPVLSDLARACVRLETPLGKDGVIECMAEFLVYVSPDYCVNKVHEMRHAGPPAPAACSCSMTDLMRYGCKCGHLARESS